MRLQVERAGNAYRTVVRGNVGDARSYTKILATPSQGGGRGGFREGRDARDVELDLALNILTGHNGEAITKAEVKASIRGGGLRQLQLKGRLGSANITAETSGRGNQQTLALRTDNAGSLLRFLDLYRRMSGGTLSLSTGLGEGSLPGSLTLTGFVLRNEPALSRIIPTQSQQVASSDSSGRVRTVSIDVNEVTFTKARMEFTRSAGKLEFREAAIWGTELGFTLAGSMDFARDRVDISGTYVPAYGLNNIFAQVPLFGPLLGGGRNEGLFGVNFRLNGPIGQPNLAVNPLSAIAPGVFRKLFGAGNGDPNAAPVIPDR